MKQLIVILFCLFSISISAQKPTIKPNIRKLKNDTIVWRADSLLHKEDFKSRPKPGGRLGFASVGVFLYPSEEGGELLFYVEALFVKSKSYITKYSEYVLKHEQIHFNICELYARKLRKKIKETNFKKVKNLTSEIQKMYGKISEEHIKEQDSYDNDTEHGLNSAKQKIWEDDITTRLKELDLYSETAINIAK